MASESIRISAEASEATGPSLVASCQLSVVSEDNNRSFDSDALRHPTKRNIGAPRGPRGASSLRMTPLSEIEVM